MESELHPIFLNLFSQGIAQVYLTADGDDISVVLLVFSPLKLSAHGHRGHSAVIDRDFNLPMKSFQTFIPDRAVCSNE